jgi:hypothetical protein
LESQRRRSLDVEGVVEEVRGIAHCGERRVGVKRLIVHPRAACDQAIFTVKGSDMDRRVVGRSVAS